MINDKNLSNSMAWFVHGYEISSNLMNWNKLAQWIHWLIHFNSQISSQRCQQATLLFLCHKLWDLQKLPLRSPQNCHPFHNAHIIIYHLLPVLSFLRRMNVPKIETVASLLTSCHRSSCLTAKMTNDAWAHEACMR